VNDNKLTTKNKWESVWAGIQLPIVQKPSVDIQHQFKTYLPDSGNCSLIEIGCAPGGWMAYFNKHFGYDVSGVEYAEVAAAATKRNLEMLSIDSSVMIQDFLSDDCKLEKHDVVFSGGFIEHFKDVIPVIEKICNLSNNLVVTIVPNCYGLNGFISKAIRPAVYAEHNPIDVHFLRTMHENCGVKTLFCDHVGGAHIIMPATGRDFFKAHKNISRVLNGPARVANIASQALSKATGYTPRSQLLSETLLYIGEKA
jgi:hypothetical protein